MGRTAIETNLPEKPAIDDEVVLGAFAVQVKQELEAAENVKVLAKTLAYDGALTVGGLEDEIRFFQRRSVEAVLELGKRLLLLKEITGHGQFVERVDGLGIGERMAQKFMSATLKFSKANSNSLLALPNLTQTKLLELLILDEGEIKALNSGETVRGVALDKIDCMSVSELKAALRTADERIAAKDRVAQDNQAAMQRLQEQIAGQANKAPPPPPTPAFVADAALRALDHMALLCVARIEAELRAEMAKVSAPELELGDLVRRQALTGAIGRVLAAARQVAQDFDIAVTGLEAADGCGEDDAIWAAVIAEVDAQAPGAPFENGNDDARHEA